jgi:heterodisulfide reductase subunit C
MEIKNIVFIFVFIASFLFLGKNIKRLIGYLSIGKPENRFDNIPQRINNVLKVAIGQSKILREPVAGIIHVLIFWGFLLFIFAVLEAIIQGFYSNFTLEFLGPVFSLITFTQDIFGVLVGLAVLYALYRRYFLNIKRLDHGRESLIDATIVLVLILFVVVSMFGQNMASIAANNFQLNEWEVRPISASLSSVFFFANSDAAIWYEVFWWMHILVIFGFMNFLPYSKHLHVFASIPNVYFEKLGSKKFELKPIDLEDETIEQFGAADVDHLTWKQMLDGYTCTECGRCSDACPANFTGKLLSPREIIINTRKRTEEKAPLVLANSENNEILEKTLIHNYITPEELWACTTCNACVEACPVSIDPLSIIIEMRRYLVMEQSAAPMELNNMMTNIENNGAPWPYNQMDRLNWKDE